MAFSSEFNNQVVSRILSNELTISAARREYGIGQSTVHNWLKQVKAGVSNNTNLRVKEDKQEIPLPRGMNLRAAIAAEGHCQILRANADSVGVLPRLYL